MSDKNTNHWVAELLRLRAGYDGCGCDLCQQFYSSLDLDKYGNRVERFGDFISIEAGKAGADLWDEYHKVDHWIKNDQVFITGGKGYGVTKTGETVCLGDEKDILAGSFMPSKSTTGAMKVESSIIPLAGIKNSGMTLFKLPKRKKGGKNHWLKQKGIAH